MELEFSTEEESIDCIFYVKPLSKNNKSLCIVCMMQEEKDQHWDRYQLKCKHVIHSRCWRRWCHAKKAISCPLCNKIEEIETNMYCSQCKKWGHPIYSCPKLEEY